MGELRFHLDLESENEGQEDGGKEETLQIPLGWGTRAVGTQTVGAKHRIGPCQPAAMFSPGLPGRTCPFRTH